jgi:hypothetical protein
MYVLKSERLSIDSIVALSPGPDEETVKPVVSAIDNQIRTIFVSGRNQGGTIAQ